ncbi:MAG: UDP-N-acetylglucosamine--N-acetylmuramyl-(pentapeptide) pyrophosphoryl-undecaprenol N-acetylglucosamine transferase, partial [Chloroflexota bacterium]
MSAQTNQKVLICAGGTGGGIYPALAAAHEMLGLGIPKENLLWVGVSGEMEETLIPREGIQLEKIVGGGIAGVSRWQQLKNSLKLLWSVWLSHKIMARFRPDVVFLTGGYMALPVGMAARLRRIPSVMFLPDLEPGSALKAISRYVSKITATFADSKIYFSKDKPIVEVGYPVRKQLVDASVHSNEAALAHFELSSALPTLFVFGGSRGAWSINEALIGVLPDLLQFCQIIHISGTLTWDQVEANQKTLSSEQQARYRAFPYLHE